MSKGARLAMDKPKIEVELTEDGFAVRVVAPEWRKRISRDEVALGYLGEGGDPYPLSDLKQRVAEGLKGCGWDRLGLTLVRRAHRFLELELELRSLRRTPETPEGLMFVWFEAWQLADMEVCPDKWEELIRPAVEAALQEDWSATRRLAKEAARRAGL